MQYTSHAFDASWWGWEAFNLAYQYTGAQKYLNAREITKYNTLRFLNLSKETVYYKRDQSDDPLREPGSYLIQTNTGANNQPLPTPGYTATREKTGTRSGMIRLNVNAITTPSSTSYPTMELQNYASQTIFDALVMIGIEVEVSQTTALKLKLSISPDANDFSQEWLAFFPVTGAVTKTFNYKQFLRPAPLTVWHPWAAEQPVFTFNGATYSIESALINDTTHSIVEVNLPDSTTGCGLINAKYSNEIPRIYYSLNGACSIRIKDDADNYYTLKLNNTSGEWVLFDTSWGAAFGVSNRKITEIAFLNDQNNTSILRLWYAGSAPESLPIPCTVYKATISCELKTAYQFWVGNFKPSNNRLDKLMYTPGAAPFVVNTLNGSVMGYQGAQFYTAYQSAHYEYLWGFKDGARNVVQLIFDAQEAYTNQSQNRLVGPVQQVFLPYSVENIPFLDKIKQDIQVAAFPIPFLVTETESKDSDAYQFNVFSWEGLDPNTRWAAYCFRTMEDLARYYALNRSDLKAKKVLSNFVKFIWQWVQDKGLAPITDFPPVIDPQQNYPEPHKWALIGCCAIQCYVNRVERDKSWDLIKYAYDYITSQFISTGAMSGLWAAGQPDSVIDGVTYKQFFSFWAGKIGEFLAECLIYQNQLDKNSSTSDYTFPQVSCAENSIADYYQKYTFAFPIIENQFADGSTQQVLLSRNPVGDVIELRFEAMSAPRFVTLINFYDRVKGGNIAFIFGASNLSYSDLDGFWVFIEKPQVDTAVSNQVYGLYNITCKCRKVG